MIASSISTSMLVLTIMMLAALSIVTIQSTAVSAFANGPLRQHRVTGSSCSRRATVTTILPAVTKTIESAAAAFETKDSDSDPRQERDLLTIVPPNQGFRTTAHSGGTEVSIASMNLLAPFYNSLQLSQKTTSDYERWEFLNNDRTKRVPEAIRMAKATNADVLCLQEIEGGKLGEAGAAAGHEFTLRDDVQQWLAESSTTTSDGETISVEGYDSFVWSPLNPNNKRGDVVGLCIAWRSQHHELVEWEGYKRGMVCRLRETSQIPDETQASASFAIANLHLPARPSNVLGRLKTMSRTIRKLSDLDRAMKQDRPKLNANSIHGLIVVAGDFNSDQDSVAARLLSHGYTNYGNVRDRNYKAKVTKAAATDMSHPYRFLDSYDHGADYGSSSGSSSGKTDPRFKNGSFRDIYAPVTVSLKGRGPGIMDHLFYATGAKEGKALSQLRKKPLAARKNPAKVALQSSAVSTKDALSASILLDHVGKRSKRRKKGETRGGGGSEGMASAAHYSNNGKDARIRVEAVLATVDTIHINSKDNTNSDADADVDERLAIIHEGLPNLEKGFPSDHLPVGVLFSAIRNKSKSRGDGSEKGIDGDGDVASASPSDASASASASSSKITKEDMVVEGEDKDKNSSSTRLPEGEEVPGNDPPATNNSESAVRNNNAISNTNTNRRGGPSGISSSVQRKRNSSRTSYGMRRRHNVVLNAMTEWLVGKGATSVVLDKPLYKNELLARTLGPKELKKNLTKKSRAPDLMCVFVDAGGSGGECLVVVEVAVASDPDKVRDQKASKYQDLVDVVVSKSDKACRLATIVVRDDGRMPEGTRSDIRCLAQLTSGNGGSQEGIEAETDRLCAHLESLVSNFRIQG